MSSLSSSLASIPPQCQAAVAQTAIGITAEVNHALPIIFLIWLSFGIWIGDWTNAWTDEWRLAKRGFTPAGASYFLARFGGGLGLFCFALTTFVGGTSTLPMSCHVTDKILATFWLICAVGAQGTFMLRCIAVWENDRRIKLLLSVLLMIIAGTFVVFIVVIDGLKTDLGLLVCTIQPPSRLEAIPVLSTMVIDVVVIGLTAYKLIGTRNHNEGRIRHLLFRDGVIYLTIVVAVSATITAMILTDLPPITRVVLSPIHIVALSIAATRAQRALRAEGIKLASMSKGSMPGVQGGGNATHGASGGGNDLGHNPHAHRRLSSHSDQAMPLPPSSPLTPVTPRFFDASTPQTPHSTRFSTSTKEAEAMPTSSSSWQTSRRAANKIVLESFAMQPPTPTMPSSPTMAQQQQHQHQHQQQQMQQQQQYQPTSPRMAQGRSPYSVQASWRRHDDSDEEEEQRIRDVERRA